MNTDLDVLVFATRLVDELGETAIRMSRVRLVELTAANHTRAAAFWREGMRTSERLLSEQSGGVWRPGSPPRPLPQRNRPWPSITLRMFPDLFPDPFSARTAVPPRPCRAGRKTSHRSS